MVRYGAIVEALVLAVLGWRYYSKQKAAERQSVLQAAMAIQKPPDRPRHGQ
jgi:hypothetical protein